jgi:hypothetical protein
MTRKLKLGWRESENNIHPLCKGIFQKELYKGYWMCWAEQAGLSWSYLVCPSGDAYYYKGFIPFTLIKKYINGNLTMDWIGPILDARNDFMETI